MTDIDIVEKLVGLVKERPILYDFKLEDYHKRDIVDETWEEVAILMNVNAHECKARWQSLRNSYIKLLREEKNLTNGSDRSPVERKRRKKAHLTNLLDFLSDFSIDTELEVKIKAEGDGEAKKEDHGESDGPIPISEVLPPRASTSKDQQKKLPCECDSADLGFFKSLLPDMMKLQYQQRRKFKERTLIYLNQLLEMQENSVGFATIGSNLPSVYNIEHLS